ncbi:MAG TPA: hypothetical protein VJT67_14885 [Longimicrobiaceae bacterium]|nr:hypothetical protein [Longimicrobiaceae bacterium]
MSDPLVLRYRSGYQAPPPRRIRLEVPGWAGADAPPKHGSAAQPWHCQPFVDGATHGLELVYPYQNECRVVNDGGAVRFEGGLTDEMAAAGLPHPFGVFAARHYGMATALDLLPPAGYALRLEPHPRVFTDVTDQVPVALPGHLQRFWPRQFFAVFRAPEPGGVHVFRPGEPYAQLLLVPADEAYRVEAMEPDEAADRAKQDRQITLLGYLLAKRLWQSSTGHWFDDKYKQLLRIFRRQGVDAVRTHLQAVEDRATPRRGAQD